MPESPFRYYNQPYFIGRRMAMNFSPSLADVLQSAERLIVSAIAEDIGSGDATSLAVIPSGMKAKAVIVAKVEGVMAGLPVFKAVYSKGDSKVKVAPVINDGTRVKPADVLVNLEGPGISILSFERIALNFLQRLSGIATLTAAFVAAVQGTGTVILDTRKTTPGYRVLEKYAVRIGGAQNHRQGLYDMLLVKDNHIHAAGSISLAVRRARECYPALSLELEVKSLDQLKEALSLPVDIIQLDNMDLTTIRQSVALVNKRVPLEVSGGVKLDTVREIAATGVNYISIGALTHSAPALDVSLELVG
jgi:nicotinate-nucleotide pyrophosphorylase (carboxylating)